MRPHFKRERAHGGRVAGVDEVGRGPLAGPVVAVAVVFPGGVPRRVAPLIDDSKKLTAEEREKAAKAIRKCAEIAIGAASVAEILQLNILHASMLAMRRAVLRLREPPQLVLVDGNRAPDLPCPVECCIGGDATSLSIAAASIVAKVVRDRAMVRLADRYPLYGWHENVGYATPEHRAALRRHGPSRHHRAAFGTVRLLAQGELDLLADAAD
ncbi:MAG TPA: ribonuclease HII [Acetobacteraceae bacterium]|jgi:ribonuclease HII|nr:ribonuclease HII [Acetobacteraceae bacterium]